MALLKSTLDYSAIADADLVIEAVFEEIGVKEKVLAAYRAGLREVILPKGNEKDVREVPAEVREHMAFTFASSMDEVLRLALLPAAEATSADTLRMPADVAPRLSDPASPSLGR